MVKQFLILMAVSVCTSWAGLAEAGLQAETHIKKITKAPSTDHPAPEVTADLGEVQVPAAAASEAAPDSPDRSPAASETPAPVAAKAKEEAKAEPAKEKPQAEIKGVPAETALRWLTNGNTRYTKKSFRKDGRSPEDRKRLSTNPRPHAIVLSCSDSRTPPEIIFDQALGEIVTIRVAGPALDNAVIASVEEALETLDPHLLIVMGHDKCPTIESAMKVKDGAPVASPAVAQTLSDIRVRLKTISPDKQSPNFEVEAAVNADGIGRELIKRSEIVRKKVEAGDLVIKPALYHLESGKVSFY